jgi:hypothetical protein
MLTLKYIMSPKIEYECKNSQSSTYKVFCERKRRIGVEISGSHSDEYEDGCLVGCCVM